MANVQQRRLGPEPWGDRVSRARQLAGFNVREVEEILFPHISKSALIRLEALQEVPTSRKDRARAALVLILYGFDFDEFGVTEADIPPAIDLRALERLRSRGRSTGWLTAATLELAA
jgi:hypothetical protein